MKKLLYAGVFVTLVFLFTIPCFAIDSTYTQLDFVPVDEAEVYQSWSSPVVTLGTSVSVSQDGYTCTITNPGAYVPGTYLGVKAWSEGDYLFKAQGMSLYVLCLDMRLMFTEENNVAGQPLYGNVKVRFLDIDGEPASNFIYNSSESSDHFVKYFTFVLRETSDLYIYGLEAQFVYDNSSSPDSSLVLPNRFQFMNFGYRIDTGVDEVQLAIMNGVDVLVYGNETLQKLQAAGFESFDEFVNMEEVYFDYVHSKLDHDFWATLPRFQGNANAFLFIRVAYTRILALCPHLSDLIFFAIAVGVVGLMTGVGLSLVHKSKSSK